MAKGLGTQQAAPRRWACFLAALSLLCLAVQAGKRKGFWEGTLQVNLLGLVVMEMW